MGYYIQRLQNEQIEFLEKEAGITSLIARAIGGKQVREAANAAKAARQELEEFERNNPNMGLVGKLKHGLLQRKANKLGEAYQNLEKQTIQEFPGRVKAGIGNAVGNARTKLRKATDSIGNNFRYLKVMGKKKIRGVKNTISSYTDKLNKAKEEAAERIKNMSNKAETTTNKAETAAKTEKQEPTFGERIKGWGNSYMNALKGEGAADLKKQIQAARNAKDEAKVKDLSKKLNSIRMKQGLAIGGTAGGVGLAGYGAYRAFGSNNRRK